MIEHLLVSTAVLAVALIAARVLPISARTRYVLILAGLVKFVIPTAVFRFVPREVVPEPLRVFGATTAAAPTQTNGVEWIPYVWAAIALLLFARWALLRTRTVAAALRSAMPASQRELDAVRDARAAMRIRTAIDVIRSPLCEAPAVLRIVRPVIALPSSGCDHLDDDELRSLVLHECAHVARHDNLAAIVQAMATSLLWFHPLVWLASRALTAAREQACDEHVADAMRGTDAYLDALAKICRDLAAPRTAGASCMAGANLKERMEHLMHYDPRKKRVWMQRATIAAAIAIIGASTIAVAGESGLPNPYEFTYRVSSPDGRLVRYDFTITEKATGRVIKEPRVTTMPNQQAEIRTGAESDNDATEIIIRATGTKEHGTIHFEATENGTLVQRQMSTYDSKNGYSGEPISIQLRGADIKDVMNTFAQLTGLDVQVDRAAAETKITFAVTDMPWDQALEELAQQHGLVITVEGKTIRVSKK